MSTIAQKSLADFRRRFRFDSNKALFVGVERESFTVNQQNEIVPGALQLVGQLANNERFGYEFSACQVEERIGPCNIDSLKECLDQSSYDLKDLLLRYQISPAYMPIAPHDLPMDYYPDPSGRYRSLAERIDKDRLRSAFRVAAVHIHVGMESHDQAIRVYNGVIHHIDTLCRLGDLSNGERLSVYRIMAQHVDPQPHRDWDAYFQHALEHGFVSDPRQCWTLIRISQHGTIEFRMFDTTENNELIAQWGKTCFDLCKDYL